MKILLDTQVLIWLSSGSSKLGSHSLNQLRDPGNELYLSYFSLFELSVKAAVGKMQPYEASSIEALAAANINLVMPTVETLQHYRVYNKDNGDPFDNILIATALAHGYILMTSDQKILGTKISGLKLLNAGHSQ